MTTPYLNSDAVRVLAIVAESVEFELGPRQLASFEFLNPRAVNVRLAFGGNLALVAFHATEILAMADTDDRPSAVALARGKIRATIAHFVVDGVTEKV